MNNQNILRKGRTKLDSRLDNSELYDYELVQNPFSMVDIVLDYSEYYDYDLIDVIFGKVDVVLDFSEFYDYKLGNNVVDYIYYEPVVPTITGKILITDDNFIITTNDNYMIEYV